MSTFEVSVGRNARLWVKGSTANDTILIYNIFKFIDQKGLDQVDNILQTYKGFFSINQQI